MSEDKKCILIIDDEDDVCQIVKEKFEAKNNTILKITYAEFEEMLSNNVSFPVCDNNITCRCGCNIFIDCKCEWKIKRNMKHCDACNTKYYGRKSQSNRIERLVVMQAC